jgi:hypothetical protein
VNLRPRRRSIPLRTSLWFAPAIATVVGLVLFVAVDLLDLADADLSILPSLSAADWRVVLGAILGAEATVLAVVFSVTMLVLQTAAGQMGPRLIRRFMRDPITQCTIASFVVGIGLSTLALLSLQTDPATGAVRPLTPTLAVLAAAVTLGLLVAYLHRTATAIQVQYVVAGVDRDLRIAISDTGGEADATTVATLRDATADGRVIEADTTGYVIEVRSAALVTAAERIDARVEVTARPGRFVVQGEPIARAAGTVDAGLDDAVRHAVRVGPYRTVRQDPEFAVLELVEIAIRALSPAVNDTFTAIACVDWIGDAILVVCEAGLGPSVHRDDRDVPRVLVAGVRPDRVVTAAIQQIRQAATDNPAVTVRLLEMIARTARVVDRPDVRAALRGEAEAIAAGVGPSVIAADRAIIHARLDAALEGCGT